MGLARILIPRRKENVVYSATLFIFCCFIIYYNGGAPSDEIFEEQVPRPVRAQRDYQKPTKSESEQALGDMGAAVELTGEDKLQGELDMKTWFMNVRASDKISLDRSLKDVRREECKNIKYDLQNLPKASVIIIFTDEAWSPLLRTVHSVVSRSPPEILKEVILLDDNSQREELKDELDKYISSKFNGIVKIIRKTERHGLIRAKLAGAKEATGDVIVFLDSHCEASPGWLEPLVQRIKDNRKAIVCPIIDHISAENMAYHGDPYATSVGGFSWALHFTWESMPESERKRRSDPTEYIRSPTMAGGLLAANKDYFFEVGSYDEEMDIWGGENLEISFRVWQCGGSIEFIPCSHVGHIFRAGHPYNMTGRGGNKDVHGTNSKRLAEVWMDDYKRLYYMNRADLKTKDVGDLSARRLLRENLNCKSFKWYLDNVIPGKFIMDEDVVAYGTLFTNVNDVKMCTDTLQKDEKMSNNLGIFHCQGKGSAPQLMSLSKNHNLRRETNCATIFGGGKARSSVLMTRCQADSPTWTYEKQTLKHDKTGLCLTTRNLNAGDDVVVDVCDQNDPHQKWSFVDPRGK